MSRRPAITNLEIVALSGNNVSVAGFSIVLVGEGTLDEFRLECYSVITLPSPRQVSHSKNGTSGDGYILDVHIASLGKIA
jgi:hypothetical protein